MQAPPGSLDWLEVSTAAERPEVWERARGPGVLEDLWPEYNHHGNNTARYFGALVPQHAHLQVLFVDRRSDRLVGRGRTIPFRWAGTLRDLPAGIDALGLPGPWTIPTSRQPCPYWPPRWNATIKAAA